MCNRDFFIINSPTPFKCMFAIYPFGRLRSTPSKTTVKRETTKKKIENKAQNIQTSKQTGTYLLHFGKRGACPSIKFRTHHLDKIISTKGADLNSHLSVIRELSITNPSLIKKIGCPRLILLEKETNESAILLEVLLNVA
jgi:hypothetical protein